MSDLQKEAILEMLEVAEASLNPKGTWKDKDGKTNPRKLARRIQMSKFWTPIGTDKLRKTPCGVYMPPKQKKYTYTAKDVGISAMDGYWHWSTNGYTKQEPRDAYWWSEEDKMPQRGIDVIHAHAHHLSGDTGHGAAFAQDLYELMDSQYQDRKETIRTLFEEFDIVRGRNRRVTQKPRHSLNDYKQIAPTAADALRNLIKEL